MEANVLKRWLQIEQINVIQGEKIQVRVLCCHESHHMVWGNAWPSLLIQAIIQVSIAWDLQDEALHFWISIDAEVTASANNDVHMSANS